MLAKLGINLEHKEMGVVDLIWVMGNCTKSAAGDGTNKSTEIEFQLEVHRLI